MPIRSSRPLPVPPRARRGPGARWPRRSPSAARAALFDDEEARKRIDADEPAAGPGPAAARGPHRRARNAAEEPGPRRPLQPGRADQGRHRAAARPDRGADARAGRGAEAPARPLRRPRLALRKLEGAPERLPPARRRRHRAAASGAAAAGAVPPRRAAAGAAPPGAAARPSPPPGRGERPPRRRAAGRRRRREQRAYDAALDQFKQAATTPPRCGLHRLRQDAPAEPARAVGAVLDRQRPVRAASDFRAAIASQRQLLAAYPDSQKAPDALLNIASSQFELGDTAGSRRTLEELVAQHPQSEAAAKARSGSASAERACRLPAGNRGSARRDAGRAAGTSAPRLSPPASSPGSARTAATTCRGRARATPTGSGCPRSCCSRRR